VKTLRGNIYTAVTNINSALLLPSVRDNIGTGGLILSFTLAFFLQ